MTKWLDNIIAVISITAATVFLLLLFDRRPVLRTASIDFLPGPVVAGSTVWVAWTIEEFRKGCDGIVYPLWIDAAGNVYDLPPESIPYRGGQKAFVRERIVPSRLPPGDVLFAPHAIRWCNPVQHWLWPMTDDTIPVVKAKVQAPP